MADRNTIFMLDDIDENELGGFNDAPDLPVDDGQDDTEDIETPETEDKPGKDDADDTTPETQEKEEPVADDPKPAVQQPAAHSQELNIAVATIAKQSEQINQLMEQVRQRDTPPAEELTPPEKPVFTQDQWDENPQGCNDSLHEYYEQKRDYDTQVREREQRTAKEHQTTELKAAQDDSWALSVEIMPELAEHPKARQAWGAIFNNPGAEFSKDPNGPLKATQALRKFMEERDLSFDEPAANAKPDQGDQEQGTTTHDDPAPAEDTAAAARQGAEDEAARQRRVRRQVMHTGGHGGQQTVALTKEQKTFCKQANIKEESFAESLAALGMAQGDK